jgi:hypothetical protein
MGMRLRRGRARTGCEQRGNGGRQAKTSDETAICACVIVFQRTFLSTELRNDGHDHRHANERSEQRNDLCRDVRSVMSGIPFEAKGRRFSPAIMASIGHGAAGRPRWLANGVNDEVPAGHPPPQSSTAAVIHRRSHPPPQSSTATPGAALR